MPSLKSKAIKSDAIIVVVGEMPYSEGFGSITDINLPADQLKTIEAALATGKPVILIMIAGRPRIITSVYEQTPCGFICRAARV